MTPVAVDTRSRRTPPGGEVEISWSDLYAHRRAAAARFGKSVFRLPLVKRVREVLLSNVRDGDQVLEVGAGQRLMRKVLVARYPRTVYESLDIDPRGEHDYRRLDEIREPYDVVMAFEVVEHLELQAIPRWLGQLRSILRPGGKLLLSTPNTYYPPAYLRDATHRTALCYDELAGMAEAAGLHVERVVRVYHDPIHRMLLRRYLFGWLFRLIGIDFARQIVVVASAQG